MDQARAALRDIRQGQTENVQAYSTRFEALLGNSLCSTSIGQKPNLIWVCTHVWLNWSHLQG